MVVELVVVVGAVRWNRKTTYLRREIVNISYLMRPVNVYTRNKNGHFLSLHCTEGNLCSV